MAIDVAPIRSSSPTMLEPTSVAALPFLAAIVFLLAGLAWFAVGGTALRRTKDLDDDVLYNALGVAACLTGAAFIIGVIAWTN